MTQYYAYLHARPNTEDASGIFYVGKGKGGRSHDLSPRNIYHANVLAKHGGDVLVGRLTCSSEKVAFDLEVGLIKCLKRMGVRLTNQTNGGEGTSGLAQTEDHRSKIGAGNRGKVRSAETLKKLSESHKGIVPSNKGKPSPNKGVPLSIEHKAKLSVARLANNPMRGSTHSEEAKAKIGAFTSSTRWVNKDGVNKRAPLAQLDSLLTGGWICGRMSNKHTRGSNIERK